MTPRAAILVLPVLLFQWCVAQNEPFTKRVVAAGFNSAWEVIYGPHDSLWITENKSYKIQRVNSSNGGKTEVANIKSSDPDIDLPASGAQAQGGLMGLALHPALYSENAATRSAHPWVYAAYVYKRGACPGTQTSCLFSTRIVRFRYSGERLSDPTVILDNLPGSSDHNSGRLVIGPEEEPGTDASHTQYRLYYTIGDMGAGRSMNTMREQHSLNKNAFEGKVLRLNTEDDGDGGADSWAPDDNPFFDRDEITASDFIYSYGHRNAQGLAWGKPAQRQLLYSSEQLDKTDDEINIIEKGRSYGWDSVAGYCDGNVNGTRIGQTENANEQNYCSRHSDNTQPIYTLFTASAAEVSQLPENDNSRWKTVALSSIGFYGFGRIPGWNNSLLLSALKRDHIFRLVLNSSGTAIVGDTLTYFGGDGDRIRRITPAPDGVRFYVARDLGATAHGGTVMEYSYIGAVLSSPDSPSVADPDETKTLSVYPNPVRNTLTVTVPRTMQKPFTAELYSLQGILLSRNVASAYNFQVDMAGISAGTYVLRIRSGSGSELKRSKIIKL